MFWEEGRKRTHSAVNRHWKFCFSFSCIKKVERLFGLVSGRWFPLLSSYSFCSNDSDGRPFLECVCVCV